MLETQRNNAAARLTRLAGLRAAYANLLSEATNRAKLLDRAEQNLTNARSNSASAKAASLITRVDAPDTGTSPVSPERGDDRVGRPAGRPVDRVWHRSAHRAGGHHVPRVGSRYRAATGLVRHGWPAARRTAALASSAAAVPQHATPLAPIDGPWSMTVAAHGSLNCTQALKVLNEQGKFSAATPA